MRLRHQLIQPDADVPELQRVLASLAVIYAALLTRLGEHGPALRWWRTASNAADDSGDLDLRVVVRGMAAGCGLYGQRHPSTILLLLLDEIRCIGVGSRSLWAVDIKGTRAKALSLLGRHDEARAALRALRSVAPTDTPVCPIPTLWLPDQVDFAESWSLAAGGDEQRAGEARERVLATTYDYQYIACVQLHGALCTVAKKGIAEGVGHAAEILDAMPPHYRNQMITETAKHVLAAVPKTDRELPAVRDYREVLATTAPVPHAITA